MAQSCSVAPSQRVSAAAVCYPAVDRCRILMALFVIVIHYNPFTSVHPAAAYFSAQYITRLAVPFFFCCNGYFLYRAAKSEGKLCEKILASFRKALRMYLFWTIIYSPLILYSVFVQIVKYHASPLRTVLGTIRNIVFVSSYTHLWYLLGLCVALLMLWFLRIRCRIQWKYIGLLACALYFFGAMYDAYRCVLQDWGIWQVPAVKLLLKLYVKIFVETRNGIFLGFPFLVLGILIARKSAYRPRKFYWIAFLVALAFGACETAFLWRARSFTLEIGQNMCLFLPPAIYFLFCLLVQRTSAADTTRTIRKFSSLLFLIHPWVIFVYTTFYSRVLGNPKFFLSTPIGYCVIVAVTCVVSVFVLRLSRRSRFAWVKQFY